MFRFALASALATAAASLRILAYEDCGIYSEGTHAHMDVCSLDGCTGTVDEDVTSANFTVTVTGLNFTQLSSCSGDGTQDIVCDIPCHFPGAAVIVKALSFPIPKGTVSIPIEFRPPTIPAAGSYWPEILSHMDVQIAADEQNGEPAICLNVHTVPTFHQCCHGPMPGSTCETAETCHSDCPGDTYRACTDFCGGMWCELGQLARSAHGNSTTFVV
jgi:hypothetical protein